MELDVEVSKHRSAVVNIHQQDYIEYVQTCFIFYVHTGTVFLCIALVLQIELGVEVRKVRGEIKSLVCDHIEPA